MRWHQSDCAGKQSESGSRLFLGNLLPEWASFMGRETKPLQCRVIVILGFGRYSLAHSCRGWAAAIDRASLILPRLIWVITTTEQ